MTGLEKWKLVMSLQIALINAKARDELDPPPRGFHHKAHLDQDVVAELLRLLQQETEE